MASDGDRGGAERPKERAAHVGLWFSASDELAAEHHRRLASEPTKQIPWSVLPDESEVAP